MVIARRKKSYCLVYTDCLCQLFYIWHVAHYLKLVDLIYQNCHNVFVVAVFKVQYLVGGEIRQWNRLSLAYLGFSLSRQDCSAWSSHCICTMSCLQNMPSRTKVFYFKHYFLFLILIPMQLMFLGYQRTNILTLLDRLRKLSEKRLQRNS